MAVRLGARAERLGRVRALLTTKGRREQGRFAFEGATLLEEADRSGMPIEELFVTEAAFGASPLIRKLDTGGTPTYLIDQRSAARLSGVETPRGILAVSPIRLRPLVEVFAETDGVVLVLGDLNDPANAGTLLRSADAFGALGVVFGRRGVDPYHPKVVRGAMGAIFRLPMAVGQPPELAAAAAANGFAILGLRAGGTDLAELHWPPRFALIVGHERRGLGDWEKPCERFLGIRMAGDSESLNAAVAGSIALYEATQKARP